MGVIKLTRTEKVCLGVLALVIVYALWPEPPKYVRYEKGNMIKAANNCRQIILALKAYAADHDGKYPDSFLGDAPRNSNAAFRPLLLENIVENEMIFSSPVSPYVPDGILGDDGQKNKALETGENHWALTAGMDINKPGHIPLVYENPADASWPPKWSVDKRWTNARGRTWTDSIIVGLNDGSVSPRKLAAKKGNAVGLAKERDGKDLFELAIDPVKFPKGEVLDIDAGEQ
jgi:hypothetical protein